MKDDQEQLDLRQLERVVSLPAYMVANIDEAAQKAGISFDTWLAQTVAMRFLSETQRMAIAEWERMAARYEKQIAEGLRCLVRARCGRALVSGPDCGVRTSGSSSSGSSAVRSSAVPRSA